LLKEKKPVDFPEVWKQVRNDFEKQTDLQNALIGMQQAGLITWVKTPTVRGWLAVKKVLDNRELYVDYSLLKEYNKGAKL
ncbi:MAG TPA: hypothetical protein V6C65_40735, partial [Allocoleopsis sp.]